MKIKIKSLEELKSLENYESEDKYALTFRLKNHNFIYIIKDYIGKTFECYVDEERKEEIDGNNFFIEKSTGRRFISDLVKEVIYDSIEEKAQKIKKSPYKEVLSMPIDMNKVTFKSTIHFFNKEIENIKNNTVRKVDWTDERFDLLQLFKDGEIKSLKIEIVLADNNCCYFERYIKDVTFWEDLVIITWYI